MRPLLRTLFTAPTRRYRGDMAISSVHRAGLAGLAALGLACGDAGQDPTTPTSTSTTDPGTTSTPTTGPSPPATSTGPDLPDPDLTRFDPDP